MKITFSKDGKVDGVEGKIESERAVEVAADLAESGCTPEDRQLASEALAAVLISIVGSRTRPREAITCAAEALATLSVSQGLTFATVIRLVQSVHEQARLQTDACRGMVAHAIRTAIDLRNGGV